MNQCGYRREFCVLRFKTNVIHTTEIKKPITAINQTSLDGAAFTNIHYYYKL